MYNIIYVIYKCYDYFYFINFNNNLNKPCNSQDLYNAFYVRNAYFNSVLNYLGIFRNTSNFKIP